LGVKKKRKGGKLRTVKGENRFVSNGRGKKIPEKSRKDGEKIKRGKAKYCKEPRKNKN